MSRRNRLLIWVGVLLALLVLFYASLPWLLSVVIRHELTIRGLRDIRVSVDYPKWHGLRVHTLAFTAVAGDQRIVCQIPQIEFNYEPSDLITGRVRRVRIPLATVRVHPVAGKALGSGLKVTALPLAALVSGRWLTQLPVRTLSLAQLKVDWQVQSNVIYSAQLRAQLQAARLQAEGQLHFPLLPKPLTFSLNMQDSGLAHLVLLNGRHTNTPLLQVAVTSVTTDSDRATVKGRIKTQLTRLFPLLASRWQGIRSLAGITGQLDTQWQLQFKDSSWRLTGKAGVPKLGGYWNKLSLPESVIQATFAVDSQAMTLHGKLTSAARALVLQIQAAQQLASGTGHADLSLQPLRFSESGFKLSHLLKRWPFPFEVSAGQLSARAKLDWRERLKSTITLHLEHLGGHYNKIDFAGLSGDLDLNLSNGIATHKDALLELDTMDIGFPVKAARLQFALAPVRGSALPLIRVRYFTAQLLGGHMRIKPFELNFSRDRNPFVVQLEHIGLNEIMQLEQQQELQGSGSLDGQIPVMLSRAGVAVSQGQLDARAPGGVIRYSPTDKVLALAQSNPSVKLVVQAMSNFHYQVLQVRSDYQPTGELAMKVHLEGKNPDWQAGKPLHLNLNLQENIPILLRSLQLSDDISEQLRQHYQKP